RHRARPRGPAKARQYRRRLNRPRCSRGQRAAIMARLPQRRDPMFNRNILIVLVVALAAGLGLVACSKWFGGEPVRATPELATVRLFPQPRELPPFALQQSDGTQLV